MSETIDRKKTECYIIEMMSEPTMEWKEYYY